MGIHTHTTARSHTARFSNRLRVALTLPSRRLCLLVRTRRDIKFPMNPKIKDRQYMMVRAMVLGSWSVQSSMLSRSAKSLEEKVDRDKEEEEGWLTKVDVCLKDEEEVVENKGEGMREEYGTREEGNSEGRL